MDSFDVGDAPRAPGGGPAQQVTANKSAPRYGFNTAVLPLADQFEAWRQLNSAAIDLAAAGGPAQPFDASMAVWKLGGLVYTHARLPGHIEREWSHWQHRSLDHWCLVLPNPERMAAGQRPIGFRSLAVPFHGAATDHNVHTLYIPRALFGSRASTLDHVPVDIPDTGLGALLADYLLNVYRRLPQLTAEELPRLVEMTRVMILACTLPTRDRLHEARNVIGETMFERARQLVEQNLLSPDLGAEFLSARLGLSRSNLYRLFENDGGVERFIRRRRLQDAHVVLADPINRSSIQAIGEARGFQDAASFSRAFRREFGYSPGEARGVARPQAATQERRGNSEFQLLGNILREL